MSDVELNSPFVRHVIHGQRKAMRWDAQVLQLAQEEGLSLSRLADAQRILQSYYPLGCRRAWTCIDDAHCAVRGRHAEALAKFELTFGPAQLQCDHGDDDALTCITSYLRQGKDGYWLWEALVEDVQSRAMLTADGKERVARWFACAALRAYYPYIRGQLYWNEITGDYGGHARHVLELIGFEYEFTRAHRDVTELERERRVADRFAARLKNKADRQICDKILEGTPSAYSSTTIPDARGVYARFREADDPLPMYVGMGNLRSAMKKRHKRYSGDREIYLMYFEDDSCQTTEKKLLSVFDPPENSHRTPQQWIQHPDDSPQWFSVP